jgi:hypothetical protein
LNNFGDDGALGIAEAIKRNDCLLTFDLSLYLFSSNGITAISKALAFNFSILQLSNLNDDCSPEIVHFLEKNNKRYNTYCKMHTFELFNQISVKKSCLIDLNIANVVLQIAGILESKN